MNVSLCYTAGILATLGSIFFYQIVLQYVLLFALILFCLCLGVISALWVNIVLASPHKTTLGAENTIRSMEKFRNILLKEYDLNLGSSKSSTDFPNIFGRTVDSLLLQLLDFIVRDYIHVYLKDYAHDSDKVCLSIKEDMWGAIQSLHEKCMRVDQAKLIAVDIVQKCTQHFEKIRESKQFVSDTDRPPIFQLKEHVMSSEKELEYLRTLSELLIMFLLPRSYSLAPAKYLIREILTCRVFLPFIDNITDPDFFNRNIIIYIESQENAVNTHCKAFELAHNFDELFKIIESTNDVESLKSIRYNIVTKLMQATTLQNLNRVKGVDLENDKNTLSSAGIQKSEINAAKKLRKYIHHLTLAKKACENKLTAFGWDLGYQVSDEFKKIFPLGTIMEHVLGRKYFTQFLETLASQDLIRYWISVEELRSAQRKNWHQLGAEIFYTFIRNPTSEIKVDKCTRKRMEAFLLGDKGPEVFYEVQNQVIQTLEDKYYQPFLISDYYKEMVLAIEKEDDISETDTGKESEDKYNMTDNVLENSLLVGDHSNYSRRKLNQLQEKFMNKSQALAALRLSLRPESKIVGKLEQEVEWLQGEQRQLEAHLNRTEVWGENLGKWRAVVQSAEVPDEKEPPQFVLVVQMSESDNSGEEESISTGWVVCRSLAQFQELNKKLRPLCSDLKQLELPTSSFKFLFGKIDRAALDKAKQQIQKYLDYVLKDERLNQSEAIYAFLSPSSEHLKHSTPSPKKSRFSFSTLFKSSGDQSTNFSILKGIETEDELEPVQSVDTVDFVKVNGNVPKTFEDSRDTIAEPLYSLLTELFDMRGVFKYVRKTLIGFVQVTYGRNINRQIHETISWCFCEQMLHYYITLILKNYWPGGALADAGPERTIKERLDTVDKAQIMILNNLPELLTTLVGNNAAKNGAKKFFDALQEKNMNKQLFYDIVEVTMDTIFPELT